MVSLKSIAQKTFYKVADPVLTVIGKPIKSVQAILSPQKKLKDVSQEFFSQPKSQQATQVGVNLLLTGGGALLGAVGKLGAVAKTLVPSTLKGKVIAGVAAPVATGIIVSSPKAREEIYKAPSALVNVGANIGEFIEDPSVQKAKDIILENPLATGLIGVGGTLLAAPIVIPALSNISTREQLEDIEEAIINKPSIVQPITQEIPTTNEAIPMANNTIPILSSDKKTAKRRRSKPKVQPSIRITNKLQNRNINKVFVTQR